MVSAGGVSVTSTFLKPRLARANKTKRAEFKKFLNNIYERYGHFMLADMVFINAAAAFYRP